MKKWRWILVGLIVIAVLFYIKIKPVIASKNIEFTYTKLERGTIEAIVERKFLEP